MITGTNGNAAPIQNLNIPPAVLYIASPFDRNLGCKVIDNKRLVINLTCDFVF